MKKISGSSGIIWEPNSGSLLVAKKSDDSIEFPWVQTRLGENKADVLKDELSKDYGLGLRFVRMLPDSWSRVLLLHSDSSAPLWIYYVYAVVKLPGHSELISNPRRDQFSWIDPAKINSSRLHDRDGSALESFRDLYNIVL